MRASKRLWAGAMVCLVAFALDAPIAAQPSDASTAAAIRARTRETNKSLLDALLARRAELERMAATAEEKRAALRFLDKRIAQVRSQID